MLSPQPIRRLLTSAGTLTARPAAFVIVGLYFGGWLAFDRQSLDWHAFATLATWLMTLFIQRAEHRDTQALQLKMDELLRAVAGADTDLKHIDKQEPEEIEAARAKND